MITNNIKFSKFAIILVCLGIGIYSVLTRLNPLSTNDKVEIIKYYWEIATQIAGYLGVIALVFCTSLWKLKIFHVGGWLVPFPNLNGTWKGTIISTWVNPSTSKTIPPIPAVLSIKQSFFKISCVMYTEEMKSISYNGSFYFEDDNQISQLRYMYQSNPNNTVNDRNPIKQGAMCFNICENNKKLEGNYWTDICTKGTVNLIFWKKENVDCYPKEIGQHPMSNQ